MRVAILGLAKTGTTALYSKLLEAMPESTDSYFEPGNRLVWKYRFRRFLEMMKVRQSRSVVAKFILFNRHNNRHIAPFGHFDHRILIVRDPRDRLVSALLYWAYHSAFSLETRAANNFIAMIQKKERDPLGVPLIDLIKFLNLASGHPITLDDWLESYADRSINEPLAFADAVPGLLNFGYEALVDHDFTVLTQATGLVLKGEAYVGQGLQRVVRKKGYGDWKNWFTPHDVTLFRPALQPYLDRYYPQADWDLETNPKIDPTHGSGYVRRIMNEARSNAGLPLLHLENQ